MIHLDELHLRLQFMRRNAAATTSRFREVQGAKLRGETHIGPFTCSLMPISPILHRLAQDIGQVFLGHLLRGADEEALLLHRAVDQVVYVVLAVA